MDCFHIVLSNHDVVFYTDNGLNVFMPIHAEYRGQVFPYSDWTDFVVPVIYQWIEEIRKRNDHYSLYFMDGPYRLDIQRNGNEFIIRGVNINNPNRVVFEAECFYRELLFQLLNACKSLKNIIWAERMKLRNDDCSSLIEQAQYYETIIRSMLAN